MRRTVTIFTLALLAAAALSTAALAKEGGVEKPAPFRPRSTPASPGRPTSCWSTARPRCSPRPSRDPDHQPGHGPADRLPGRAGQGRRGLHRRRRLPGGRHLGVLGLRRRHRADVRVSGRRDHGPLSAEEAAGRGNEGSELRGGQLPRPGRSSAGSRHSRSGCRRGALHPAPAAPTVSLAEGLHRDERAARAALSR